jgi:adenine deaminase
LLEGISLTTIRADLSAVTLDECVRNLVSWTSCSIAQAVECVTTHPAKLLGIADKKGALTPGFDADFVVLDDVGNVHQTWKFGEKVFDTDDSVVSVKREVKEFSVPKREGVPFGERFTLPDPSLQLAKVTSPTGVKVH